MRHLKKAYSTGKHSHSIRFDEIHFNIKDYAIIILLCMLLLSIFILIYLLIKIYSFEFEYVTPISLNSAWEKVKDFEEKQKETVNSYNNIKTILNDYFTQNNIIDRYSLYFENLNDSSWFGINENKKFIPASLLKLPTCIEILKKVEKNEISLDKEISLSKEHFDSRSGTLFTKGEGYRTTIQELLNYLIIESDNTAFQTLNSLLTLDEYKNVRTALGLPSMNPNVITWLSPKEYSNVFRSLYLSTFLHDTFSQLVLSMLSETKHNSQLRRGVPPEIKVAHKYGIYEEGGYYHDCGIIFKPEDPYILCVMSERSSKEEADRVIGEISGMVFNYFNE